MTTPFPPLSLLLQQEGPGAIETVSLLIWIVAAVVLLAAYWRIFTKAGQPGWGVLIPIYNAYLILKIAGRPGWWLLLMLIPLVNIIVWAIVCIDVAKAFGKDTIFGLVLLFLLCPIGVLILGFGSAAYQGPARA